MNHGEFVFEHAALGDEELDEVQWAFELFDLGDIVGEGAEGFGVISGGVAEVDTHAGGDA